MKWYKKIGLGLVISIIAYIIGNLVPIEFLKPKIKVTEIESAEYYNLMIGSISAIVTFLAVVIALFKEDIRKWWEYSKVEASIPEQSFYEILKNNIEPGKRPLEAEKYDCKIEVYNSGNISAMGLEIQLESLVYSGVDFPTPQVIETLGHSICWNGQKESKINLPPEGKKSISILALNAPEQQSSPEGKDVSIPCMLSIAGIENPKDYLRGKWTAAFAIFSTNAKPIRFKIVIDWNGRWENRVTEMKNHLTINLTK